MIKNLNVLSKINTKMKLLYILVAISTVAIIGIMVHFQNVNTGLADSLVRLHVLANSNSEKDQALKLQVRDAIIQYMKQHFKDANSSQQAKSSIVANMPQIKQVAEHVIAAQNMNYNVKVELGSYDFPTKQYGDIVLPAGNYQALRVVIGKGEGKNWWCVLFPPLCFVDATHSVIPTQAKDDLKKVLTKEEYELITADEGSRAPIKAKFKLMEILQTSRVKFKSTMNKFLRT